MNVPHNDLFNTPDYLFSQLNDIYDFTVDAACMSNNKKTDKGFCVDQGMDGLKSSWRGHRVFCNPPFSQKKEWIQKAIGEVEQGGCPICVMVLPLNCMSTIFFFDLVLKAGYQYDIVKNRVQFLDNETKEPVKNNNSGTVIVYFKKRLEALNAR